MSLPIADMAGKKFNRLLAVKYIKNPKANGATWEFLCDCGTVKIMHGQPVRLGLVKSCGCLNKELAREKCYKHGESDHPLYKIWQGMMERCYSAKNKNYHSYGGRGIKVCESWQISPSRIHKDMGDRPYKASIDRIDVNGNYEPSNCRWATPMTQGGNKRNNVIYEVFGEKLHYAEICRKYNIKESTLGNRLKLGMTIEHAITKPVRKRKK